MRQASLRRQLSVLTGLLAWACVALAFALAAPAFAQQAAPPSAAALARDVDRVESVRAVKQLQYAFAHYVEAGEWTRAAALFSAEARYADGAAPEATGRAAIEARLREAWGHGAPDGAANRIHASLFMAPIVTLAADGNSAKGRWRGLGMVGGEGAEAEWSIGIYENEYVRERGAWKIARQAYYPYASGPYETGWRAVAPELPLVPYHFTAAADIGRPVILGAAAPTAAGDAGPSLRTLVARIGALNDEAAIRNLQSAYGYYLDRKMWDDAVDLFDARGSMAIAGIGRYDGAAGIRRALERDGPQGVRYGELNDHLQLDVVVTLLPDGVHARARGFDLGMVGRNEGAAFWSLALFDNLFVKRGGVWRIEAMRLASRMRTNQGLGWARSWLGEAATDAEHAPDRAGPAALPEAWTLDAPLASHARATTTPPAEAERALWNAAAYDAIENLAGAYGQYLDDAQWEDLGAIFARDGERDSAGGGFIRGPQRIAAISRSRYGPYNPRRGFTSMHIRTQPVIHVAPDGRTGQERTRLFQLLIGQEHAPPAKYETGMIMTGIYEDDAVVEDGAWRFKRVDIDHLLYTLDYRHGWTRIPEGTGRLLDPPLGAIAGIQFDAPGMGDTYPPFPKVGHMWFHYRNPVSGRAPAPPQYLMPKYELPEP